MGTNIKQLTDPIKRYLTIENFNGKIIAVDAFNTIYQFLSIIKGRDGKPLKNANGEITSHLTGLLYRNINLIENNIKPIYCFDGLDKTKKLRWSNKSTQNKVRINKQIISSTRRLLEYIGIPYIQGTGEGEAQCCLLNQLDQCYGVASQDYDCLSFGAKRIIRNLAISRKRKKGNTYITTPIEFISAEKFFKENEITREQLVDIIILIGNDFYPGIGSFGEKTALKKIKESGSIENYIKDKNVKIFKKKGSEETIDKKEFLEDVEKIRNIFLNPSVNEEYEIKFRKPSYEKLKHFLYRENSFSLNRVDNAIHKLKNFCSNKKQINLDKFW